MPLSAFSVLAPGLALILAAGAPSASTQADPNEYACTVERRCSSTGLACAEPHRACREDARARGLEIICESRSPSGFVYCPPTTGRGGDTRAMWILLSVAMVIAIGGSTIAWVALKGNKPR